MNTTVNRKDWIRPALGRAWFLVVVAFVLVLASPGVRSQIVLERLVQESPTRIIAYFSHVPTNYSTLLSSDKKTIIITIKNASPSDAAKRASANGVMADIYSRPAGKDLEIVGEMKEKRQFTCVSSVFSKALIIDVFRWDKLSRAEDDFRTGQIAVEDGIVSTAKGLFAKSLSAGIGDAGVHLGILYLQLNKPDSAIATLRRAEKAGASMHDLYAALAQAYSMKKDPENEKANSKIFTQRTGIAKFGFVPVLGRDENSAEGDDSLSLLNSLADVPPDSANKNLKMTGADGYVFEKSIDSIQTKDEFSDFISPEAARILFYGLIGFGVFGLILLRSYLKWRKDKLKDNKKPKVKPAPSGKKQQGKPKAAPMAKPENDNPPDDETNQPARGVGALAANAYRKSENISRREAINSQPPKPKPEPVRDGFENLEGKLDQIAQRLIKARADQEKTNQPPAASIPEPDESTDAKHYPEKNVSPKVELALRLQQEQNKLKSKNLSELNGETIPDEINELTEVAKKLGVETSSLETKKRISELEHDKKSLSELKSKFVQNKGK